MYVRTAESGLLQKAVDQFDLSVEDMFQAVADCNNNFDAIDMEPTDVNWDKMTDAASCFWPMVYADASCLWYLGSDGDGSALKYHGMEYVRQQCGDNECTFTEPSDAICDDEA